MVTLCKLSKSTHPTPPQNCFWFEPTLPELPAVPYSYLFKNSWIPRTSPPTFTQSNMFCVLPFYGEDMDEFCCHTMLNLNNKHFFCLYISSSKHKGVVRVMETWDLVKGLHNFWKFSQLPDEVLKWALLLYKIILKNTHKSKTSQLCLLILI